MILGLMGLAVGFIAGVIVGVLWYEYAFEESWRDYK